MSLVNISRVELGKQLPLAQPFSLHIFPSFYCNFACTYCLHSMTEEALQKKGFFKKMMPFSVYKKAIDDVKSSGWKLKALMFAGHGEPLMHPEIADMIAYAEANQVADRTEIVTNASLLKEEISDRLIHAGLKRLRISIQGVSSEAYRETCGKIVDFEQLVKNIEYFYRHKKDTEIYIKIIDVAIHSEQEKSRFYDIFSKISDRIAIEYAIPFVKEINYDNIGSLTGLCKQGNQQVSSICSMPFYMMVLYPDGKVYPCCSTDIPCCLGDIHQDTLQDIWNSRQTIEFLCKQLDGVQHIPVCKDCSVPAFGLQDGDYLDHYSAQLKLRYRNMIK